MENIIELSDENNSKNFNKTTDFGKEIIKMVENTKYS